MPNRNYITGRRFEYKVRDLWKDRGYRAVRTAGSHSPYDVIALRRVGEDEAIEREVIRGVEYTQYIIPITGYAIQCKRRKLPTRTNAKHPNHRQDP
jgi:hypothetical protein